MIILISALIFALRICTNANMSDDDISQEEQAELLALLTRLKTEHLMLDDEITALRETGAVDMLKIVRMKKVKLKLKERIVAIENKLTPDIIA